MRARLSALALRCCARKTVDCRLHSGVHQRRFPRVPQPWHSCTRGRYLLSRPVRLTWKRNGPAARVTGRCSEHDDEFLPRAFLHPGLGQSTSPTRSRMRCTLHTSRPTAVRLQPSIEQGLAAWPLTGMATPVPSLSHCTADTRRSTRQKGHRPRRGLPPSRHRARASRRSHRRRVQEAWSAAQHARPGARAHSRAHSGQVGAPHATARTQHNAGPMSRGSAGARSRTSGSPDMHPDADEPEQDEDEDDRDDHPQPRRDAVHLSPRTPA